MDKTKLQHTTIKNVPKSKIHPRNYSNFSNKNPDELLEIGNIHFESGNIDKALNYYENAYNIFKNTKDIVGEGYALTGIGICYEKHKMYSKAKEYYLLSLKKFKEIKDNKRVKKLSKLIGNLLLTIADEKVGKEDPKEAKEYYNESLSYYNKAKDPIGEGYALAGIGIIHEKYKEYEESREYFEKATSKFQKAKDFKRAGISSKLIANSYESQNAIEDALIDYERSLELFKKAKDLKRETEIKESIISIQKERSRLKSSKKGLIFLFSYLLIICIAELVTTYSSLQIGLIIHSSVLLMLLIHSSIGRSYNYSNLLMSMMAIPLIRIVSLTMPLMEIEPLYRFLIISIPIFAASFTIIRIQKLHRKNIGLKFGSIPVQFSIALSGFALGFIEYYILKPESLIPSFNLESLIIPSLIILLSTGFAEELLFRGIIQKNAENLMGNVYGLLYTSILFTSLHIGWNSSIDWIFVFFVALFYGYVFQRTRSLFGVTLSHGISNSILFLVMPFYSSNIINLVTSTFF